jgi:formylglycine-generating enzyme required for sulfatase activity
VEQWAAVAVLAACLPGRLHAAEFDVVTRDQMEFITVPAGRFMMGMSDEDCALLRAQKLWTRFDECEQPLHSVAISKPFLLSRFEITQKQWKDVMGKNPSAFKGEQLPVESVSWEDVQQFIQKLNEKTQGHYRLPTEAEWEYCCRAGSTNLFGLGKFYDTLTFKNMPCQAWYRADSDNQTHPVGEKHPNAWGFYDMHGNVWEWCQDWYADDYYRKSPATDPVNNEPGVERVFRGGC